jgi:hypothetical protein
MTKTELSRAVRLAQSDADLPTFVGPGSSESLNRTFEGFGLPDFQAKDVTIVALAALVRHQCVMMNGDLDHAALEEIASVGRRKFNVVGFGADDVEMERTAKPPHWYANLTD